MLALSAALFGLLTVFLASLFIVRIFITTLERLEQHEDEEFLEVGKQAILSIWDVVVVSTYLFIISLFTFFSHLATFWYLYLALGMLTIPAEAYVQSGPEINKSIDAFFTSSWVPFYRNVILLIFDLINILCSVFLCIWNVYAIAIKAITAEFIRIAVACEEMKWDFFVLSLVRAVEQFLLSLADWILSFFSDEFQLTPSLDHLSEAFFQLSPLLSCECQMLDFTWQLILGVGESSPGEPGSPQIPGILTSPSLRHALDRFLNFILDILRDVVGFGIELLETLVGVPVFRAITAGEEPERPPRFEEARDDLCLTLIHLGDWIDDVFAVLMKVFFSVDRQDVPPFGPILANPLCSLVSYLQIVVSAVFHIDVIVLNNYWPTLQKDFDPLFTHLYNTSIAVEKFWKTWDNEITDDVGCFFAHFINASVAPVDATVRAVIGILDLIDEPDEIFPFLKSDAVNGALERGTVSAEITIECAAALITHINAPLGRLFNETGHTLAAIIRTVSGLIFNLPEFLQYVQGQVEPGEFETNVLTVFFELRAMAIAVGNVVRQFNILGTCPLEDPHANPLLFTPTSGPPISQNVDVFCCLGAAIEGWFRFLIELLRILFVSTVLIFREFAKGSDFSEILLELLVVERTADITLELIPTVNATIYGALCFSFGALPIILRFIDEGLGPEYFDCGLNLPRLWEAFWRAMSEFFTFLLLAQLEVVGEVIKLIPLMVFNPPGPAPNLCLCPVGTGPAGCGNITIKFEDGPCGCPFIVAVYDAWVGRLMFFVRSIGRLIACITKIEFFSDITDTIYRFFGIDGEDTLRDQLCPIVGVIADIVQFISLILQGKLLEAITELILSIPAIAKIINSVNKIWAFLTHFSERAKDYVVCLFNRILLVVKNSFNCIFSCFTPKPPGCDKCGTSVPKCGPLWNDPVPVTIAKRQEEEPIFLDIPFELNPNSSNSPCYEHFLAATADDARPADRRDFKICATSATITQIMDLFLFNTNSSDHIVDPMLFYDPFVTFEFLENTSYSSISAFNYISSMVLDNNFTENYTIADFFDENNITDRFSIRAGLILEVFVRAMVEGDTKSPLLTTLTSIWRYGFQFWFDLWNMITAESDPTEKKRAEPYEANPLGKLSTWTTGYSIAMKAITKKVGGTFGESQSLWSNISSDWKTKSGYAFQEQHLDYSAYLINTVRSRIKWNYDGRPAEREPYPLGNIAQRNRHAMLERRIKNSKSEEEEAHWRGVKSTLFPRWENPHPLEKRRGPASSPQALIESDCPDRRCWDDVGNVIGGCDLSRLSCGCTFFNDPNGTCCAGNISVPLCLENVTEIECLGDFDGTWVPGGVNCSSTCDAIRSVNSSFGACCTPDSCQLTSSSECSFLNGTWNPSKTCSNSRLSELCDNCRNRNLPNIDITSELFCPIASAIGEVSTQPCANRKCRDDDGNEIATCIIDNDPVLGRLVCGCDTPANVTGACCTVGPPVTCVSSVVNFSTCEDLAASDEFFWKEGRNCLSCFADQDLATDGEGACCHGDQENTTCEITNFEACVSLGGIFDEGKSCDSINLNGKCNRCQAEGCRECAWLLGWINDVTDATVSCIDDILEIREERENRTVIIPVRSFIQPYDPPIIFSRHKGSELVRWNEEEGPTSLTQWIIFIMESIVNWFLSLFGVEGLDFATIVNAVIHFFTTFDRDDPRSFVFWFFWLISCDFQEMSRCEEGRQGLGLGKGILVAIISMTIIFGLLFRVWKWAGGMIAGTILFGLFIFVTLGVAYFYSPACAINPLRPSPPIIPNCLCEDLRNLLGKFDVDCLPLCDIACTGNFSCNELDCECLNPTGVCVDGMGDCPRADVDFMREFPQCHLAPYNFLTPFRLFTFAIRSISPGAFCFLSQTHFPLFSWIKALPGGEEAFDFGEDSCVAQRELGVRWDWCFWSNFWLWFPLIGASFFGIALFAFFIAGFIFLLIAIVDLIVNILFFFVMTMSRLGRFGDAKTKFYREDRDYEVALESPPKLSMQDTMQAMSPGGARGGGPTGFSFRGRRHPNFKGSQKKE